MPADTRPIAIALMGPTASGKTALSIQWARDFDGEVVSVDSALVYRGLDIGAAKPSPDERAGIAHHMIDTHEPWQRCSAAEFAHGARLAMDGIRARGRLPILVGGTGLYFRALLQGLAPMPDADAATRALISDEAGMHGWPALHAQLARIDPEAALRIHATDAQRIARALEVYRLSGQSISQWQREAVHARLPWRVLKIVVAPRERSTMHARIAARVDTMLDAGLLDEVRHLRDLPQLRALTADSREGLPALRAVGYRQALEHLDSGSTLDEFRDRAIFATRQLAKRQVTWLRGQLDARRFDPQIDGESLQGAVQRFVMPRRA